MVRRVVVLAVLLSAVPAWAQEPVSYRVSFPAPEHHWMQVEVTFPAVPAGPLQIRMSRSSPGRYALHEFAKNVYDVQIRDGKGNALTASRPSLHGWDVAGHDGTVVVTYKIYGDRVDGTYLGIDSTHAHLNMPASLMFARGWDHRPAQITFVPPAGRLWRVASQLYPTANPNTFAAPNLHYLMDSPTELSAFTWRYFEVPGAGAAEPPTLFRIALHHDGTDEDADAFARDTEKIVRETRAIFGEFPSYENNTYTFLSDYLPWASGDGMEHRNSTVLSGNGALRDPGRRTGILGTVAHEYFHSWNMERIRSKAIEPFNFEDANVSGELWLGEGFTSYYDDLIMRRTGLAAEEQTLGSFAAAINAVTLSPGRKIRSAEDMSRLAPFVDAASSIDRTNWSNTFISYYTWGAAIGLGLDLTLRDRSNGATTLDDFMRALWTEFGKPGQKEPGMVATPYTMDALKVTLSRVTGDRAFAEDFFARYIQGHDVVDYAKLLARVGLMLRRQNAGHVTLRGLGFSGTGARFNGPVQVDSGLYKAGVDLDDEVVAIDGVTLTTPQALAAVLGKHKDGETVPIRFVRRSGETVNAMLALEEDPRVEIVPAATVTPEQKKLRDAWLGTRVR